MIVQASKDLPNVCHVDSHMHLKCKWSDGVVMANLKAKNIYRSIDQNKDIIKHVNNVWYSSFEADVWKKYFDYIWKSPIEPKIKCFKWLVMLDRLPIKRVHADFDICSLCKLPDTSRHILFDCLFAKEIWKMFGIIYPINITIIDIVTSHISSLHKDSNIFFEYVVL